MVIVKINQFYKNLFRGKLKISLVSEMKISNFKSNNKVKFKIKVRPSEHTLASYCLQYKCTKTI
jgi:hypothetical protein